MTTFKAQREQVGKAWHTLLLALCKSLGLVWLLDKVSATKTLWIVGQNVFDSHVWEFQGVFDSEERAIAACHGPTYWISPCKLNEELPKDSMSLPGTYFPKF